MLYESIPAIKSYSDAFAASRSQARRGSKGIPCRVNTRRVPLWMSLPNSSG